MSQPAIETFTCDRQGATLTKPACARMWRSTRERRPQPWEGRHACIGCPLGAAHAGEAPEAAAATRAAETLRRVCPRCSRPASRLINKQFCVSCYNRTREVARGRNAKGNPPRVVASRLHRVALAVGRPGAAAPSVEIFADVTGTVEAMLAAAKRAVASGNAGPVRFGPPLLSLAQHAAAASVPAGATLQ